MKKMSQPQKDVRKLNGFFAWSATHFPAKIIGLVLIVGGMLLAGIGLGITYLPVMGVLLLLSYLFQTGYLWVDVLFATPFVVLGLVLVFGWLEKLTRLFFTQVIKRDIPSLLEWWFSFAHVIGMYFLLATTLPMSLAGHVFGYQVIVVKDGEFATGSIYKPTWRTLVSFENRQAQKEKEWIRLTDTGTYLLSPRVFIVFKGTEEEYQSIDWASL